DGRWRWNWTYDGLLRCCGKPTADAQAGPSLSEFRGGGVYALDAPPGRPVGRRGPDTRPRGVGPLRFRHPPPRGQPRGGRRDAVQPLPEPADVVARSRAGGHRRAHDRPVDPRRMRGAGVRLVALVLALASLAAGFGAAARGVDPSALDGRWKIVHKATTRE